jgi:hypothetical protein
VIVQTNFHFEIEYVSTELNLWSEKIENTALYLEPDYTLFIPEKNLARTNRGKLKQFKSLYFYYYKGLITN